MRDVFPPTPLLRNAHLSERFDADICSSAKTSPPVRSYKLRGAFNAMRKQGPRFSSAQARGITRRAWPSCAGISAGRGVIFMPVTTPQQKIQKTRMFGGDAVEIRMTGDYFDDCLKAAQDFCAAEGGHFLSPFDDEDVIEGQAAVAVEMANAAGPRARIISCCRWAAAGCRPGCLGYFGTGCLYTFVEPAGGACLRAALEAGKPVRLPAINSFADGAAVARIGDGPSNG